MQEPQEIKLLRTHIDELRKCIMNANNTIIAQQELIINTTLTLKEAELRLQQLIKKRRSIIVKTKTK